MTYGAKFVIDFLSKRIGVRAAKQVIYVVLLVFGVERKKIREVFGASDVTLCKYNAALKDEDLTRIFEQNYNHPQSKLEAYRDQIEREFEINPPSTRREAAVKIEKMTGIKRSLPRMGNVPFPTIGKYLKKGGSKAGQ